jgi:membrane protein required for colicin V production
MADAAALCVVFLVPLIAIKVAAAAAVGHIPDGALGAIDRFGGAAFGAARGAVVVSAAYLGLTILVAPEDHPEGVKHALLLPYVKDGAVLMTRLMPEGFAVRGLTASRRTPRPEERVLARPARTADT